MYEPIKKPRKPLTATQAEAGADNMRLGRLRALVGAANQLRRELSQLRTENTNLSQFYLSGASKHLDAAIVEIDVVVHYFDSYAKERKLLRTLAKEFNAMEFDSIDPAKSPPTS